MTELSYSHLVMWQKKKLGAKMSTAKMVEQKYQTCFWEDGVGVFFPISPVKY